MNKKIATWVGTIILIIMAITAFYFVKKTNDINNVNDSVATEKQTVDNGKKEADTENNILPPLTTVEGMVEQVTKEGLLTIKDKNGQRNIVLPASVYVYGMVKNLPQAKSVDDIKNGATVVVQLKANTETQEASSVLIK